MTARKNCGNQISAAFIRQLEPVCEGKKLFLLCNFWWQPLSKCIQATANGMFITQISNTRHLLDCSNRNTTVYKYLDNSVPRCKHSFRPLQSGVENHTKLKRANGFNGLLVGEVICVHWISSVELTKARVKRTIIRYLGLLGVFRRNRLRIMM